jgi:hypothetical protein
VLLPGEGQQAAVRRRGYAKEYPVKFADEKPAAVHAVLAAA